MGGAVSLFSPLPFPLNVRPWPGPHSSSAVRLQPVKHPMHKAYHSSLPATQRRAAQSLQNCRHRVGKNLKCGPSQQEASLQPRDRTH